MSELEVINITKDYGNQRVLQPISISVERGEFVTILGPSGCGKSTLLRILMGINKATAGEINLAGKRIDEMPPEHRDIAMVFQSYALFPHMTVSKNLSFGLRMKKVPGPEREARIAHAVEICNLKGLLDRMPRQLSGGQQQRVALARAIVMQPSLLLFDEPLSNLDAKLRDTLRHELVELHRRIGATSIYVTHDQAEAMAMSDRIVVMEGGRVIEVGTPLELYRSPKHAFTAGFLGLTNVLQAMAEGGKVRLPWGQEVAGDKEAAGAVRVSARPENMMIKADQTGSGTVAAVSFMGASALYSIQIGDLQLKVSQSGSLDLIDIGAPVSLSFQAPVHLLDDSTYEAV